MPSRQTSEAGFTLIEILSVLVIVGVMSSVVVLSIPQPKSALDLQSQRLVTQINALAQEGIISGQVTAIGVSTQGYALYSYSHELWDLHHEASWEEGIRLTLKKNDKRLDVPDTLAPFLTFSPNGISTPFELTLSSGNADYTLQSEGDGKVMIVSAN